MDATLRSLRAIVGADHVVTDRDRLAGHVVDWTGRFRGWSPALVRPGNTEETAAVVETCRSDGVALVPQGGNTGLVGGSIPGDGELIVHLGRMATIDVDELAGQVTVGAGATVADVQAAAAAAGWRYGVDFAARDTATIGGSIATNAGGLRVIRHGMTRRQLLGVEAVLGNGAVISHLGGLVKDNTGYDLAGLLCGSEGTLGIVTRARLALVPGAGATVTALVGCRSTADAVAVVGALRRAVPTLEAAEMVLRSGAELVAEHSGVPPVFDPVPPVLLVIEAVGPPDPTEDVARVLDDVAGVTDVAVATDRERAGRLWQVREWHTEAVSRLGPARKFDVSVAARDLSAFVDGIGAVVSAVDPDAAVWVFGHVADGNVHVNVTGGRTADAEPDPVGDAVLGQVIALGGSISAEHGIGRAKRRWLPANRTDGDLAAMRSIKAAFDPDGICNPRALLD